MKLSDDGQYLVEEVEISPSEEPEYEMKNTGWYQDLSKVIPKDEAVKIVSKYCPDFDLNTPSILLPAYGYEISGRPLEEFLGEYGMPYNGTEGEESLRYLTIEGESLLFDVEERDESVILMSSDRNGAGAMRSWVWINCPEYDAFSLLTAMPLSEFEAITEPISLREMVDRFGIPMDKGYSGRTVFVYVTLEGYAVDFESYTNGVWEIIGIR